MPVYRLIGGGGCTSNTYCNRKYIHYNYFNHNFYRKVQRDFRSPCIIFPISKHHHNTTTDTLLLMKYFLLFIGGYFSGGGGRGQNLLTKVVKLCVHTFGYT
jgi:hypothetical protein